MRQPGLGVMVKAISVGDEDTRQAILSSFNKTITNAVIIEDNLYINFDDNIALRVWDGGQSCCEHRYMTCDDNLEEYSGTKLINVQAKPATYTVDEEWGNSYETMFLEFETTNGVFTIVNHNSHNGYYGGFWVEAEVTDHWIPRY